MTRPQQHFRLRGALGLLALLLCMSTPASASLKLVFLDVGQGDATLVSAGDHHVLIDGGRARDDVTDPLHEKAIRSLDLVVATHAPPLPG